MPVWKNFVSKPRNNNPMKYKKTLVAAALCAGAALAQGMGTAFTYPMPLFFCIRRLSFSVSAQEVHR